MESPPMKKRREDIEEEESESPDKSKHEGGQKMNPTGSLAR